MERRPDEVQPDAREIDRARRANRIVVGIDGSEGSLRALSSAGREARLRGATLEVVAAWTYPTPVLLFPAAPEFPEVETLANDTHDLIDGALDTVADDIAGVSIERRAIEGSAPAVLLDRAKEADLLVVGSRGHGGFGGLLLGSVSQQCVQHATSPVMVVPSAGAA
jgi:nucleotide-binding universal stress UspA family protein